VWAQAVATITKWPSAREWRSAGTEALWLAPMLALLGVIGGFVGVVPTPDAVTFLGVAAIALIVPAFAEELVFRVLLLGSAPSVQRCALAVALFVAWHPLQVLIFGEQWGEVVLNPVFLCAVAVLGVALTRGYLKTRSIWPPVILHWATVLAWKMAGGPSPWN
jgi:uncharacterized protein